MCVPQVMILVCSALIGINMVNHVIKKHPMF